MGKVTGEDQAEAGGIRSALRMAKGSLIKRDRLGGCAERIESYSWLFEHVLQDCRGFYLFVDSAEKMAKIWTAGTMGAQDLKTKTAALLGIFLPDISELYVKSRAEYQRRKEAGYRAFFGLAS